MELYTIKQTSAALSLHPKTVRRFIRDGRLKARKVGREWRVRREDLRAYAHGELAGATEEPVPTTSLADRVRVSAVVEVDEGHSAEVARISNTIIAALNTKEPSWGPARYDLIYHPETRKARFVLFGTPAFLGAMLELLEVLTESGS